MPVLLVSNEYISFDVSISMVILGHAHSMGSHSTWSIVNKCGLSCFCFGSVLWSVHFLRTMQQYCKNYLFFLMKDELQVRFSNLFVHLGLRVVVAFLSMSQYAEFLTYTRDAISQEHCPLKFFKMTLDRSCGSIWKKYLAIVVCRFHGSFFIGSNNFWKYIGAES